MAIVDRFSQEFFLTAGMCDQTSHLPLQLLTLQFIDTASLHANSLGIGFAALIPLGIGWVLSKLTIEMTEWPGINAHYRILTWIEAINHHLSERCARVEDLDGKIYGYIRSTWACIDYRQRKAANLSVLSERSFPIGPLECPIEGQQRLRRLEGETVRQKEYTFQYCDTDFNRHVNSTRYIELLQNVMGQEFNLGHSMERFEICYLHEALGEQTATVTIAKDAPDKESYNAMVQVDTNTVITSRMRYRALTEKEKESLIPLI